MLASGEAKTLVPLDATDAIIVTYEQIDQVSVGASRAVTLLKKLLPYYFRAHHQFLGVEGIRLREVVALAAVMHPELFRWQSLPVDVEVRGDLTRGATVFDRRRQASETANAAVALEANAQGVVDYMTQLLR